MKAIVETKGTFQLMDPGLNQFIPHNRPAVVTVTPFIQTRLGLGQLTVVAGSLPDIASDAELVASIAAYGPEEGVSTYLLTLEALSAPTTKAEDDGASV